MRPLAFGLDITDTSIELVSLLTSGGKHVLGVCARTEMPTGVMVRGVVSDVGRLTQAVGHLLDAALGEKRQKIEAGVSLPETQAYSKVFALPANLGRDMAVRAAAEEADQTFPLSSAAASVSSAVLAKGKETQDVLFVQADSAAVQSISEALKTAGIKPLFIEPESLAAGRALLDSSEPGPVLVADIGAKTTMLAVYENGLPRFSSNVLVAGDRLSEALETKMHLTMEKAEGLKRRVGFDPAAEGGRTYLVLQQSMADIVVELNRTVEYYRRRKGKLISKLVLSGGTSLLPGIADYLSSNLPNIDVSVGNPFRGFVFRDTPGVETLKRTAVLYATATGLALRAGGFRKSPDINLLQDGRGQSSMSSIIGQAREIGAFLTNMVKRTKSTAEEPKHGKSAKHHPKPVLDIPAAAESEPVSEAKPAHVSEPVKAEPTAVESAGPPPEKALAAPVTVKPEQVIKMEDEEPAEESSDESGKGVGDLLHGNEEEGEGAAETVLPATGSGKLTIESIISGKRLEQSKPEKHVEPREEEEREEVAVGGKKIPGKPTSVLPLIVVVMVLAILTAAGVYLLAKKSGFDAAGVMTAVRGVVGQFLPAQKGPEQAPDASDVSGVAESEAPTSVSLTVTVGIADRGSTEAAPYIKTRAAEVEVSAKGDYAATGKGAAATGKAKGKVTIINETSRSYTFVATTRFLTKDGVLFRMDKATNIPASGSVETAVTADKPGPTGDIGPSDFTIPGLSAEQQKVIYARSSAAMTGGSTEAKMVTAEDLGKAKDEIFEKLKAEAEEDLRSMTVAGEVILPDLVTSTEVSASAPTAGAIADSFTVQLAERFRAMLFPQSAAEALMREKAEAALPEGEKIEDYDLGDIQYTVEAYETASDLAEVRLDMPMIKL